MCGNGNVYVSLLGIYMLFMISVQPPACDRFGLGPLLGSCVGLLLRAGLGLRSRLATSSSVVQACLCCGVCTRLCLCVMFPWARPMRLRRMHRCKCMGYMYDVWLMVEYVYVWGMAAAGM